MTTLERICELCEVAGPNVVTSAAAPATSAGVSAFANGGNAFDAALAACFMETVCLPMKCGLAGDLVAMYRQWGGPLQVAVSVGPGASALGNGAVLQRTGPCSVGIPGAPSGYAHLAQMGRLGTFALIEPAVRASEVGVPWDRVALSYLVEAYELLQTHNSECIYLPNGEMPMPGDLRRLPGLGRMLKQFASMGATLFSGEEGERLVAAVKQRGGFLTMDDMRVDPLVVSEPLPLNLPGQGTLYVTPAPTGGPRLAGIIDRALRTGAPLLDIIREDRKDAKARGRAPVADGTSVVTAADSEGNAVVVVHSNSFPRFGSGVVLDDGLVLNNRPGRGFDLGASPDAANAPKAGRVPQTTLHAWALQQDSLVMGATPGGVNQLPWNAQTLMHVIRGGTPGQVVSGPRWALDEADRLSVEPGADVSPDAICTKVDALSHRSAQQVLLMSDHRLTLAAADPRVHAVAAAHY